MTRHLHPAQGRGLLGGVEDDLQGRGDPADEGGVAGRVDLDLQAARALGGVIQGGLQDDAAHDLLGTHQGPGRVIGALKAEPAAPVSGHAQRIAVQEVRGQTRARAGGQLNEGLQAHRPREVQVQVRLGQGGEVSHGVDSSTCSHSTGSPPTRGGRHRSVTIGDYSGRG